MPYPERAKNTQWGNWKFNPELLTLTYEPFFYQLDLERMSSSAQILDFIFQAHTLACLTDKDKSDLLKAIDGTLYPQNNYCSFGVERMTPQAHVKLMKSLSADGELVNLKAQAYSPAIRIPPSH